MTNQLQNEKSPYLLQHADNPVDWYPWCEEAFNKAQKEDKPVFLSIGYSTCHWCHVMAHESFEDQEVANLMNETFVNIKVDREERPDIDDIYMTVCQMATGRGGWPLTVLLTPEQKPFFAATYLPKQSRGQQIGMLDLIPQVQEMWENNREEALESAEQVMQSLQQSSEESPGNELSEETLDRAVQRMNSQFDQTYGGFGNEPKFPSPHNFLFLLRYAHRTEEERPLEMVKTSLRSMRQGGVYDQVGFGFHRYATDRQWKLPHFEKMLYDQALLAEAYLETYQVTDDAFYRRTADEIFTYVLRDLRASEGGFYSAEDADSEEGEGVFYQWTVQELERVLDGKEADLARQIFNVQDEGNFREEASGERTGRNVLHPGRSRHELAEEFQIPLDEFNETYETIRTKLFEARSDRTRPHLDDKVLTSWNGLMISALARGGAVLDEPEYISAAREATSFIQDQLHDDTGRLLHRYRDGDAAILANADDYAFFIRGLIDLYEATSDSTFLAEALEKNEELINHFWDEESGGFYFTSDDGEELITRKKSIQDGAKPSSNSMAYRNLLTLSRLTGNHELEDRALELERAFSNSIGQTPFSFTMFLCGLNARIGTSHEIVVAGPPENARTNEFLQCFRQTYLPNSVLLYRPTKTSEPDKITELAPFTEHQKDLEGHPAIYVCTDQACEQPTDDLEEALSSLRK